MAVSTIFIIYTVRIDGVIRVETSTTKWKAEKRVENSTVLKYWWNYPPVGGFSQKGWNFPPATKKGGYFHLQVDLFGVIEVEKSTCEGIVVDISTF